jgi:hypothetical protein
MREAETSQTSVLVNSSVNFLKKIFPQRRTLQWRRRAKSGNGDGVEIHCWIGGIRELRSGGAFTGSSEGEVAAKLKLPLLPVVDCEAGIKDVAMVKRWSSELLFVRIFRGSKAS